MVSKITMSFARNKHNSDHIHINDIDITGYQPDLECICCNAKIDAKLGNGGLPRHFAHHQNGKKVNFKNYINNLRKERDKIIHSRAQNIVSSINQVFIPRFFDYQMLDKFLPTDLDDNKFLAIEEDLKNRYLTIQINDIEENKYIKDYIPDLFCQGFDISGEVKCSNFPLAIEILNTHAVDPDKKSKIERDNLSAIEINFSSLGDLNLGQKGVNLDNEIYKIINDKTKYKRIHFSYDLSTAEYVELLCKKHLNTITSINKKIIDKREKVIQWAYSKNDDIFTLFNKAKTGHTFLCLCCEEELIMSSNNFKHKHINNHCKIFEKNKHASFFYQQSVFCVRLGYENQQFELTTGYPYTFIGIEKSDQNNHFKNYLIYKAFNEQHIKIFCNFSRENVFTKSSNINVNNFKTFDNMHLENILIGKNLNLHDDILIIEKKIKQLVNQKTQLDIDRKHESNFFSKHNYFYNEQYELTLKDSNKIYRCLFCKNILVNFQHKHTDECYLFSHRYSAISLEDEYNKILYIDNFDSFFKYLRGKKIVLENSSNELIHSIYAKIKREYFDYNLEHNNELNFKNLIYDFVKTLHFIIVDYKKTYSDNIILICESILNKQFYSIELDFKEKFSNSSSSNIKIPYSKNKFNDLCNSLNEKFISLLFDNINTITFNGSIEEDLALDINTLIGSVLDKKILEYKIKKSEIEALREQARKEQLRQYQIQQQIELQKRKEKEETERLLEEEKRLQQEDENKKIEENYLKILEERRENERKEKQIKEEISLQKKLVLQKIEEDKFYQSNLIKEWKKNKKKKSNHLEAIKKKINEILNNENLVFSNYKFDKNDLEYIVANDIIFINKIYDFIPYVEIQDNVSYILKCLKCEEIKIEYLELLKKCKYIVIVDEDRLIIDNIKKENMEFLESYLFINPNKLDLLKRFPKK